jgi:hypothetical protein
VTQTRRIADRRDDRRLLTWPSLTEKGTRAFVAHLDALQVVASGSTSDFK